VFTQLQMVLQVLADAQQVMHTDNAHGVEAVEIADARKFEDLGRADASCRHDNFACSSRFDQLAILAIGDPASSLPFEQDFLDVNAGHERQVGAVQDGLQEAACSAPAPAAPVVHLEIG